MSTTTPSATDAAAWISTHDSLTIVAWRDSAFDDFGFDPRSDYVETYWLVPASSMRARRSALQCASATVAWSSTSFREVSRLLVVSPDRCLRTVRNAC
jgi:hypothetical protein